MPFATAEATDILALVLGMFFSTDPAGVLLSLLRCLSTLLWLDIIDPLVLSSSALASNEVTLLALDVSSHFIQTLNVWILPHSFY